MKYYTLARRVHGNSTLLDQVSHRRVVFSTGCLFPSDVVDPFVVVLDPDFPDGELASMYTDPAVIVKVGLLATLQSLGLDNFEVRQVVIRDTVRGTEVEGYVLLNILGRVACAALDDSDVRDLGEGLRLIDGLTAHADRIRGLDLFLVDEDSDCIVISERVRDHLVSCGYSDLYFEPVRLV